MAKRFYLTGILDDGDRIRYVNVNNEQEAENADSLYVDFLEWQRITEAEAMAMASVQNPIYPEIIMAVTDSIMSSEVFSDGSELQIANIAGETFYFFSAGRILFEEMKTVDSADI